MKSKLIIAFIASILAFVATAQPPNNAIFFGSNGDGFSFVKNVSASNTIFVGGIGDGVTKGTNGVNSNDIFKGGRGDGFNLSINNVVSNSIFLGGTGDGWNKTANTASSNNIFVGGNGDGWNKSGNAAISNSIFIGGNGDGWNKSSNAAISNNIFIGGKGDGWNILGNVAPSNNIFLGGIGDGWSSVYRPQGPLPVTLLFFTAQKSGSTASLLQWKTSQEINSDFIEIERSADAVFFTKIGKLPAAGFSTIEKEYSYIDNTPQNGTNYYRLKLVDKDGRFTYSPARLVIFNNVNSGMVKFYPNPVRTILTVQLPTLEPAVVNITNALGVVVYQLKQPTNTNNSLLINVSNLPKGSYFLQVKTATSSVVKKLLIQ